MLDRKLYGQEKLAWCQKYRGKDEIIIIKSRAISEKRFQVPADMWNFHVGCSRV